MSCSHIFSDFWTRYHLICFIKFALVLPMAIYVVFFIRKELVGAPSGSAWNTCSAPCAKSALSHQRAAPMAPALGALRQERRCRLPSLLARWC